MAFSRDSPLKADRPTLLRGEHEAVIKLQTLRSPRIDCRTQEKREEKVERERERETEREAYRANKNFFNHAACISHRAIDDPPGELHFLRWDALVVAPLPPGKTQFSGSFPRVARTRPRRITNRFTSDVVGHNNYVSAVRESVISRGWGSRTRHETE